MALILNIETATKTCSVALARDGEVIALKQSEGEYNHAENLTPFIDSVIKEGGISLNKLDAIAVSKGPGSYTGLRIGVSTAKGLCFALNKPLIGVETLETMVKKLISLPLRQGRGEALYFCPMIDARRMEVYCAIFDHNLKKIKETSAEIINENSFSDILSHNKVLFFGDGAEKCREALSKNTNTVFVEGNYNSAAGMATLSEAAFNNSQFENLAYFEPFYLKDFVGTVAKNKL